MKEGRGGAREDQERTAELVTVDAGLPGARRWKNDGGQGRARGGIYGGRKRARGERREEELGVERRVVLVLHYLECGAGHAAESRTRGNGGGARQPRRQAVEQVAGTGVDMVERRFGPVTGRFGPWAQNEVFYTRPALHFSLRDQGHLSNGLAVN